MHVDVNATTMTEGNQAMRFGIKVPTKQGLLFCICLKRKGEVLRDATEQAKPMPIARAHALLRHHSEVITRKTTKELG